MLNVAPVSTKYLSLVNSSVRKIDLAFAGKSMAVAVVYVGIATEPVKVGSSLVIQPGAGFTHL